MKNVYFIGIGGIGMSALARFFKRKGYDVSGYDKTPSELTAKLEQEGIPVHHEDDPGRLPPDPGEALIVYTPAVPEDTLELKKAKESGYAVIKRAEALALVTRGGDRIAISGTHGKTTTTTLVSHILIESGMGCTAFLGGISRNYGTNFLDASKHSRFAVPPFVFEADEYDRSFLQVPPDLAVITSVETDHLGTYSDHADIVTAFKAFAGMVSGTLIVWKDVPVSREDTDAKVFTYHLSDPAADFHAYGIQPAGKGRFRFDLHYPGGVLHDILSGIPGLVNVENAVAAAAAALCRGVKPEAVRSAVGSFQGVKRRLEVLVDTPSAAFVDDYAHHPTELKSAIAAIRDIFPGRHVTAVFQPHLFSRTKALAKEFGQALGGADRVILLDIYPAREEPVPGVSSYLILKETPCPDKVLIRMEDLPGHLATGHLDVLVTFGAGSIGSIVESFKETVLERCHKTND